MIISMVAAAGENNALGKDGKLLWHLPHDIKRFKKITMGNPVIMGRKTFETLPNPLPGRKNIIITKNKDYKAENCIIAHNLEEAIEKAKEVAQGNEICIVGGGEIYKQGLPFSNKIELTRIHHNFNDGDAFFPELDYKNWNLQSDFYHAKDIKHKYAFSYLTFVKK